MTRFLKWMFGLWLAVFILSLLLRGDGKQSVKQDSILRVVLAGALREAPAHGIAGLIGDHEHPSLHEVTSAIRGAAGDARIKGLVLQLKALEVTLAQMQELEGAMADFRKSGKWSASHLETAGELGPGDGTYALAVTTSEVLMSPPGSIKLEGLRAVVPFLKGAFDKLGIGVHFYRRHEYKNAADTFTQDKLTPAHREALGAVMDDLHTALVEHLAARRAVPKETVTAWMGAPTYSSAAAFAAKLIDGALYWDELEAKAKELSGHDDPWVEVAGYDWSEDLDFAPQPYGLIFGLGNIQLGEADPLSSEVMGADTMAEAFQQARDAGVKGILFRVDSPGGSYVASDIIRREVELCRKAGIPVVVSMGSVAGSGGYLVSIAADHIVAQPTTITGSIGVLAGAFSTREFWRRWLGVTFDSYATLDGRDGTLGLDPLSPRQEADMNQMLDHIYKEFVQKTADARGKTYDEIHTAAKGRIWSGTDALSHGLIDELGGVRAAVQHLKKLTGVAPEMGVRMEIYPQPDSPLELLRGLLRDATHVRAAVRTLATAGSVQSGPTAMGPWQLVLR